MENSCEWYDPSCAINWLGEEIKAIGIAIYDAIISGVAYLIELIPVPSFLLNIQSFTLDAHVAWAADSFNLVYGLGVVVTAYTARFVVRRLPIVG